MRHLVILWLISYQENEGLITLVNLNTITIKLLMSVGKYILKLLVRYELIMCGEKLDPTGKRNKKEAIK